MQGGHTVSGVLEAPTGSATSASDLFLRWRRHRDQRAREQLVAHYLPLARRLARRYRGAREPIDDLEQVASLGLIKAIDRYDPERGNSFNAYAVPTILGELKRYFRDTGWAVHTPRGIQERALDVERATRLLAARTGRSPTFTELAAHLELSVEQVLEAAEAAAAHHAISIDAPREDADGDTGTIADTIGEVDPSFGLVELGGCIGEAARGLSERERRVLALRFVEDHTQSEIAREIGVSQMQVSRILRAALGRLSVRLSAG